MMTLPGKTLLEMLLRLLTKYRALIALTLLAAGMWLLRVNLVTPTDCTDDFPFLFCPQFRFGFLLWNTYLAWMPIILLELPLAHSKYPAGRWIVIGLAILFFPNAPYLITDLIHLRPRAEVPLWYDALLLFSFAYLGLKLALQALRQIRNVLQAQPSWIVEATTLATLLLSGLGIYLGRVLRWNSWDALLRPQGPIMDIVDLFIAPFSHHEAWLMIFLFSSLIACVYWLQHDTVDHHKT